MRFSHKPFAVIPAADLPTPHLTRKGLAFREVEYFDEWHSLDSNPGPCDFSAGCPMLPCGLVGAGRVIWGGHPILSLSPGARGDRESEAR